MIEQIRENFRVGMDIATQISEVEAVLPQPMGIIFEQLGVWASRPFGGSAGVPLAVATLGAWLGYGIWVMLIAKLFGGRGTLPGFFGTTALFAIPQLLLLLAGCRFWVRSWR